MLDNNDEKVKEKIMFEKDRHDREQEHQRYQRTNQRYRDHERAPRRTSTRDQREIDRDRDYCSYEDCNQQTISKKHCKSDWKQPLRHKVSSPHDSTLHTHHITTSNQHPRRRSRSPDHRV